MKDTKYWHEYIMKATEIRFIKGRLEIWLIQKIQPLFQVVLWFTKPHRTCGNKADMAYKHIMYELAYAKKEVKQYRKTMGSLA
jgi:hypothetical protein